MKIIVAPGAFKNSLRATDAADAIAHGLERSGLAADVVQLPIADGGNGTLDVMLAASPDGAR
ncbi:MAG: glycerate kinase, partial [Chloroflexota bacterium]